jgi:hypothetical protein
MLEAPHELLARAAAWEDMSRWERAEIGRALRRLGWSYGEIREVIPVPKGTLAGWCREVRLTEEQVAALRERTGSFRSIPRDTQAHRRAEIEAIRLGARSFALSHVNDAFFVAGTVMYWAEGAKTGIEMSMANSDPRALRLFTRWVRTYHDDAAKFVLRLHLHAGNDEAAAQRFWARAIGLSGNDFYRSFIKPKGTGHRKNHLPHGVCTVRMRRGADAHHRTMAWIDAIAEIGADSALLTSRAGR